jgi:GNAT superfamily N-acetyltransferase
MKIELCHSNKEFRDKYNFLMEKDEIDYQFFLLNSMRDDLEITKEHLRGGVYDEDGTLCVLFLDANPFCLQLHGYEKVSEALKTLAEYYESEKILIKGILTKPLEGSLFLAQSKMHLVPSLGMDILKIQTFYPQSPKGSFCQMNEMDLPMVKKGVQNFHLEALKEKLSDEDANAVANKLLHEPGFYLIKEEDNIASFLKIVSRTKNTYCLSLVYTFPEYRGKGYAKSLVSQTVEKFSKDNKQIFLFVDQKNPISNHVYESVGFRKVSSWQEYRLEAEEKNNESY